MDHLSKLPDDVLCHILSFLATKEAASTSVLSTRWRNLVAYVPNLDLHDYIFLHDEEGKREREGVLESFMDFGDRVLVLQGDSTLKKFSLKCLPGVDSDRVNRWIRNALQRGVSELRLYIEFDIEHRLPAEIFSSKTLVRLKVTNGLNVDLHVLGVSLPMLKTLLLRYVALFSSQFEMLICGCPALETLDIKSVEWGNSSVTVSSASLKTLIIHSRGRRASASTLHPSSISFDTPNLVSFTYTDLAAEDYPKVNLANVVEANIDLQLTDDLDERARAPNIDGEGDGYLKRFGNVWKLFTGMKNVRELHLSSDTFEVLYICRASIPVFNNLKILSASSSSDRGRQLVPYLLRNCPSLEDLTYDGLHFKKDKCEDSCNCKSPEDEGRSLISCPVKKLQITEFIGTYEQFKIIKRFLKDFPCLTEIEIHAREDVLIDVEDSVEILNSIARCSNSTASFTLAVSNW
ncbi:unnamed protein product [Microthlaspi erraticum]|uniref:F-box domain-containing protein n=1 Tax=Microthlaspi erraticum TaxID=1685480 RepID=A0A6D2HU32_9BRAS|nr:unnamed protein product [Microthlaspi erraticum]